MNMKLKLVFIILVVPNIRSNNIYCGIPSCPHRSHTLCKYQTNDLASRCGEGEPLILSQHDKDRILTLHLILRESNVARWRAVTGRRNHTTELKWNKVLARAAQKWTNQCAHRLDQCRNLEYTVDQRLARCRIVNGIVQPSFTEIVQHWYNGDPLSARDSQAMLEGSGTRSLWESATNFGCAATVSNNYFVFFLCNYGPVEYAVSFNFDNSDE